MKVTSLFLIVLAVAFPHSSASSQDRIDPLRQERISTLRDVVELTLHLATFGRIDAGDALAARMDLLNAELISAGKESDRILFYKNALDSMKEYEKLTESRHATPLDVLRVKVTRLELASSSQDKPDESEGPTRKVADLRKERIAMLKEAVDVSIKLAKNHRIELGDALECRMILLKAEQEVAKTESDRIALYKGALDSMKEYEEIDKAFREAGRGTHLYELKIKAARLEIEIMLEESQMKESQAKK